MILVDTSIWIELLAEKRRRPIREEDLLRVVTCGPIVQEVFQGLKPGPQSDAFRRAFLAIPTLSDPIPLTLFVSAAEIYRQGRRRGIAIRSSVDCLIAAIAIEIECRCGTETATLTRSPDIPRWMWRRQNQCRAKERMRVLPRRGFQAILQFLLGLFWKPTTAFNQPCAQNVVPGTYADVGGATHPPGDFLQRWGRILGQCCFERRCSPASPGLLGGRAICCDRVTGDPEIAPSEETPCQIREPSRSDEPAQALRGKARVLHHASATNDYGRIC